MITLADIERIVLTNEQMILCQGHSLKCSLGGVSRIRGTENRRAFLNEDQITGQVCTCAMTILIYGQTGAQIYDSIRDKQNERPNVGDGGVDIPPFRLDVKGSMARSLSKDVLTYNLLVRPKEKHENWMYVLALTVPPKVALIGWAFDSDLPDRVESSGIFEGAYRKIARELKPMSSLKEVMNVRRGE